MITTNVEYNRRKRFDQRGEASIEFRVTVNRKNNYVSSGIKVGPREWRYGQVVNRADAKVLNERLRVMQERIEEEVTRCMDEKQEVNLKAIRDALGTGRAGGDMFAWMESFVDDLTLCSATKGRYEHTLLILKQWGRIATWSDCTVENIYSWDSYLHKMTKPLTKAQKAMMARGLKVDVEYLSDSGVYNYHKCLKAMLNRAYEVGRLQQNPYERLKGKFSRGEKESLEYLTEDEMHAIMNLKLTDRILIEARDVFVFQMFTGMAYSDAMAFDISNYKNVDGQWVIRNERIKTGVPFVNQLLPPAVEVLERYGMMLPYINNAEYNLRLKTIGQLAGTSAVLHSHLGRHTFGTYMLSQGVKIQNLSKMLGHTNITQTQRYAKVLAKDVFDDFDMIREKLTNKAIKQ